MKKNILLLEGDGIGPEIVKQAEKVLTALIDQHGFNASLEHAAMGGNAYDQFGTPLPKETLEKAKASSAILLGAVGGPKWDAVERSLRPERALLGIRSELGLFANLRPALLNSALVQASSLKPELVKDLDVMIVRELTGGIYFGEPRGITKNEAGSRYGFNTMIYHESEIERIAHVAFKAAMKRDKRLCSVDKANVLEVSELWREVMIDVSRLYPDVELSHMYVDNAAMQLVKAPKQFDVMVTGNLFGDILSDISAMLTGSIGMLPSASMNIEGLAMYEPIHGSAPDIAGQNSANPLATILSVAMMLRYSFNELVLADKVDDAVDQFLQQGYRTKDIASNGASEQTLMGCVETGDWIVNYLNQG